MFQYAICEIAKKQYRITPDQEITVSNLGDISEIQAKVLMLAEGGKVLIGNPYLKDELVLKVVDKGLGEKIRVFKYHAKANYRKTRGYRSKISKVMYSA